MYADNPVGKMLAVFVGLIIIGYALIMSGREVFILSPILDLVFEGADFAMRIGR
jgi:hypothetical protein